MSGLGASAAYWLAAAAGSITVSDTAMVGSIGVVGTIIDDRARQGRQGITLHQIISSNAPKKRPDPLTLEGRAVLQNGIDSIASVFTAKVAAYRGVSEKKVNADFGQGGVLVGIAAVKAGIVDSLAPLKAPWADWCALCQGLSHNHGQSLSCTLGRGCVRSAVAH